MALPTPDFQAPANMIQSMNPMGALAQYQEYGQNEQLNQPLPDELQARVKEILGPSQAPPPAGQPPQGQPGQPPASPMGALAGGGGAPPQSAPPQGAPSPSQPSPQSNPSEEQAVTQPNPLAKYIQHIQNTPNMSPAEIQDLAVRARMETQHGHGPEVSLAGLPSDHPLVQGHRASTGQPNMTYRQLIALGGLRGIVPESPAEKAQRMYYEQSLKNLGTQGVADTRAGASEFGATTRAGAQTGAAQIRADEDSSKTDKTVAGRKDVANINAKAKTDAASIMAAASKMRTLILSGKGGPKDPDEQELLKLTTTIGNKSNSGLPMNDTDQRDIDRLAMLTKRVEKKRNTAPVLTAPPGSTDEGTGNHVDALLGGP